MDLNQIYSVAQDDPNTPFKVVPMNQQTTNVFVSKSNNSIWNWDIFQLQWDKVYPMESQILQGSGAPSSPPPYPNQPALYTDLVGGELYTWNATSVQAWQ